MNESLKKALEQAISDARSENFEIRETRSQSGGCINRAMIVSGEKESYFIKLNSADAVAMFEAEFIALNEMAENRSIRIPRPIAHGNTDSNSFLILEALSFGVPASGSWSQMGRQLAKLHRCTEAKFGWHRDNTIGSTPQQNDWLANWSEFFREKRLRPQFELARRKGFEFAEAETLMVRVDELLHGHQPQASLLHGDLWSGNAGFLKDGTPVIYDPATYFGDREADLTFSEFFGGFPADFYEGYEEEWPLPAAYERRKTLYNLYHVLNHANLFGGGYACQAKGMIAELIRPS